MEINKQKKYQYYLNKIIKFNNDRELIALKEQFNQPSFFEILAKERSETTYSAFLKWLFEIKTEPCNIISPLMLFLDIIIKRAYEQNPDLINREVQKNILSRKFKILEYSIETEKYVSALAQDIKKSSVLSIEQLDDIILHWRDRVDIVINGKIQIGSTMVQTKKLQIIIENKIDTLE